MLDERKQRILRAIVDDYISTAEPIGSRTIAKKYSLGISPATIRNEMADLETLGYIKHLHTSSGRIPSSKGYRFYVDDLLTLEQMSENEISLINNWYATKVRSVEEIFRETSRIISQLTKNVSLVLAPQDIIVIDIIVAIVKLKIPLINGFFIKTSPLSYPFTEPIMIPLSKYFWKNGYIINNGKLEITIVEYFNNSAILAISAVLCISAIIPVAGVF